ncbi:MAG: hypothetical protein GY849_13600 [Deltaproteobacteria bacterium]|nr:hypothetical protein [Deltaproteobacteria bacterium]
MAKVKIDSKLYERAKKAAAAAGYASFEEFITSIIERELAQLEGAVEGGDAVADQLRGLSYIE